MPELTFVFGPNNTFFFDCPKTWKFHSIPPSLRQLFNASMQPHLRVVQPYCIALGPQNNLAEPLWYLGCKVLTGEDKLFFSQTHFETNYPDLARWTRTIPNAPRTCYVTLGPNLSYFASAPGHGSIWAGIPSEARDKIQKSYDTPNCVSLGTNNAWFLMWPDGYFAWKFYGCYDALDKLLVATEPRTIDYLSISPYNTDYFFIAFKDGTIKYNLSGEWMGQLHGVFNEWQADVMAKRAHQQYAPYPPQQQQWHPGIAELPPAAGTPSYLAAPQPSTVAAYYDPRPQNLGFIAELPADLPMTPATPSFPQPANATSPQPQPATVTTPHPQQASLATPPSSPNPPMAVPEQLPAAGTLSVGLLRAPSQASSRPASTIASSEKKRNRLSRLFGR